MTSQTKRSTRKQNWQYRCLLLAIAFYNAWILGVFINPHAIQVGATTSEFGVWGQPGALFFRCTDILAGLLFLAGAGAIVRVALNKKVRLLLWVGITSLGLSTIIETFVALDCSSALNKQCAMQEQLNTLGWQHDLHIIESMLSYSLMVLLPIGVLIALRATSGVRHLKYWSVLLLVYMVAWGVETTIRFTHDATSYGPEQYIFNIIFTIWFVQAIRFAKKKRLT